MLRATGIQIFSQIDIIMLVMNVVIDSNNLGESDLGGGRKLISNLYSIIINSSLINAGYR